MSLVRGGTSASPASLFAGGEQGVWYDPSDLSTLFQDNLGATPVTAAGQTVGRILDKSGRGNHATQATLAQRPTYQIDSTGRPYLSFDGVDDGMVTGTITPGINKVQVFAGMRKLSDAAVGTPLAFATSSTFGSGTGVFMINAPNAIAAANFAFAARGTSTASVTPTGFAAPVTSILSGTADILAPQTSLRVNGASVGTSVATLGTGNFGNHPIYIGRQVTINFFNGRLYSMIVRFGANLTTGQITSTESWVNGKTGAY